VASTAKLTSTSDAAKANRGSSRFNHTKLDLLRS